MNHNAPHENLLPPRTSNMTNVFWMVRPLNSMFALLWHYKQQAQPHADLRDSQASDMIAHDTVKQKQKNLFPYWTYAALLFGLL